MFQYFPWSSNRSWHWPGVSGLLVATVALTLLGGFPGLLFGGVLAVSWRRLPPEYSFVIGQFALVATVPDIGAMAALSANVGLLALGEAGLIAVLVAPQADSQYTPLVAGFTMSLVASGIVVGWLSLQVSWVETTWQAGAWLLGSGFVLAYSLHRYERWQLGNPDEV